MGAFDSDNDMLDRPDLNKCPDCGCFFAQDNCPLCGKPCPEEMRAGNRAAPKKQKYKYDNGYRTVMFVDWYHRWWFIALMAFIFPMVSIVLLITSPHKKSHKIVAVIIAALYMIVYHFVIPLAIQHFFKPQAPVNTSLTKEEYIAKCEEISPVELYRNPKKYEGQFAKIELTVVKHFISDDYEYNVYYICKSADGGEFEIMVRDCLQENQQLFIEGDKITVYGEVVGAWTAYETDGSIRRASVCLNMAYATLEKTEIKNSTFRFGMCCFSLFIKRGLLQK